jgi:hypothetical protein
MEVHVYQLLTLFILVYHHSTRQERCRLKLATAKEQIKPNTPPPSRQKKKSQMPNRKLINTLSSQGEEYTDSGGMNIYKG